MKRILRKLTTSIVFVLKTLLYVSLLAIFFGIFSIENWQILVLSRTAAITLSTFVVVGLILTTVYGRYDIGKRKSKPIIYSLALAAIITDLVTYVQLSIMNTNAANNKTFKFENVGLLIAVIVVQVIVIVIFTYCGNYIYFAICDPERCLVITSSQRSLDEVIGRIGKFKKQYRVNKIADYKDPRLKKYILENDTVFIYDIPVKQRTEIVEYCYQNLKNTYFNPDMADVVEFNSSHIILDDMSMLASEFGGLTLEQRFIKRAMDIFISIVGIIISSPVMLVCGILIKLEDGGKVFFKQNRATRHGRIFSVYKLRTMKEDVENYSMVEDDIRVTKIGRFLRKYRLDEFPQLINVFLGDMSVVGPRPEMLVNIFNYTEQLPEFEYRLRVKAGITGYAQISGKYNTSPKDKLILDLMYIEDYSVWLDIKLIFQTLIVLLKSDSTEAFKEGQSKAIFEAYEEDTK